MIYLLILIPAYFLYRNWATTEILRQAKNLIRNPKRWTRDVLYRDQYGNSVDRQHAVMFCALGAVEFVAHNPLLRPFESRARLRLKEAAGGSIVALNDFGTHDQVMRAFSKAIKGCERNRALVQTQGDSK